MLKKLVYKWFKEFLTNETACKTLVACEDCGTTLHKGFDSFRVRRQIPPYEAFDEYYCLEHRKGYDTVLVTGLGTEYYNEQRLVTKDGHLVCYCRKCVSYKQTI